MHQQPRRASRERESHQFSFIIALLIIMCFTAEEMSVVGNKGGWLLYFLNRFWLAGLVRPQLQQAEARINAVSDDVISHALFQFLFLLPPLLVLSSREVSANMRNVFNNKWDAHKWLKLKGTLWRQYNLPPAAENLSYFFVYLSH